MSSSRWRQASLGILCVNLIGSATVHADDYDPLAIKVKDGVPSIDLSVDDAKRDRTIPIRVYRPSSATPAPVVLFSHGLGGNREGSSYLGKHWSARGYIAVFLQHPGSDDAVWKDTPRMRRMAEMQRAASLQNAMLRFQDVSAVLDQLERWNAEKDHPLSNKMDPKRVGMSGHSFGAVTTQAVSGQKPTGRGAGFTEPRILAAIAMSPSTPQRGDAKTVFADVRTPWLLMTGTKDIAPVGGQTLESRLAVFSALPAGNKFQLVLENAEHSAFTDRSLPGDQQPRNPRHHPAILAISTAFWDAYLRDDPSAKAWLTGDGPRRILQPADRWETK